MTRKKNKYLCGKFKWKDYVKKIIRIICAIKIYVRKVSSVSWMAHDSCDSYFDSLVTAYLEKGV